MRKKSCNGCRCLRSLSPDRGLSLEQWCNFGYPIKIETKKMYAQGNGTYIGKAEIAIPLVNCPKPRTYKEMLNMDVYKKEKNASQNDAATENDK
jgi:hypothetical protein